MRINPWLRTVRSPYDDNEELVAMPALPLDAAIVHLNRADARGNAQFLGPDLYFDDLYLGAASAGRRFVSCERVVPTEELLREGSVHTLRVNRSMVDGVVEARLGAHFTTCDPDYGRDESFQRDYAASAASAEAWDSFKAEWVDIDEPSYVAKVSAR
jgi:glutaconate CoA-transferase subunit A